MRIVIIFCLFFLLASCGNPKTELLPPHLSADSVFSRDEMIHILVDIHLVEASLIFQRNRGKNMSLPSQNYYQWLYRKYHMSRQRLQGNLDYYRMDVRNFSKMYEEVVKDLTDQIKNPQVLQSKKIIEVSSGKPNKRKN
jgi:hypothetical protein